MSTSWNICLIKLRRINTASQASKKESGDLEKQDIMGLVGEEKFCYGINDARDRPPSPEAN